MAEYPRLSHRSRLAFFGSVLLPLSCATQLSQAAITDGWKAWTYRSPNELVEVNLLHPPDARVTLLSDVGTTDIRVPGAHVHLLFTTPRLWWEEGEKIQVGGCTAHAHEGLAEDTMLFTFSDVADGIGLEATAKWWSPSARTVALGILRSITLTSCG